MTNLAEVVELRAVQPSDLPIFFEHQLDPEARHQVAFVAEDPTDRAAFEARWERNLTSPTSVNRTILVNGVVAGNLAKFEWRGRPEVGYWLGREFWGRGIATRALAAFVQELETRPLYAAVAYDNAASLRVLQKCGFVVYDSGLGFAHGRNAEIKEFFLELR